MYFKSFISILVLSFISVSHAGVYKCVNSTGNTIFQALPCAKNSKELKIKKTLVKNNNQCSSTCDSKSLVCVSNLKDDTWNKDGGLDVCKEEKEACYVICSDPRKGGHLSRLAEISRSFYDRKVKYKKAIKEIDEKYENKKRIRIREAKKKKMEENCNAAQKRLKKENSASAYNMTEASIARKNVTRLCTGNAYYNR